MLEPVRERVSFDAPITRVADITTRDDQRQAVADRRSAAAVRDLRALRGGTAIAMYGGGMGELGIARGQIELLASLFHPDADNDVAPSAFNAPELEAALPSSPLGSAALARLPLGLVSAARGPASSSPRILTSPGHA